MVKFEILPYTSEYRQQLLTVWERSVLATHDFLASADFEEIRELVGSIDFSHFEVFCLVNDGEVLGFVGVADQKVEMLFLDPDSIGKGLGKQLLRFAVNELNADLVDVNEQNLNAVKFYRNFGFEVYERTDKDDQGRDYPLLRMRLVK